MKTVNFKCPECGSDFLEELTQGCTLVNRIKDIASNDGEADAEYEQVDILGDDASTLCFQCGKCGMVLKNHDNVTLTQLVDVVEWIERVNNIKKDKNAS